jgi:hypothetical protein
MKKQKLPKKFRGATVVRGLGMKADKYDDLVEKKALDAFDATRDTFVVVDDRILEDTVSDVHCFLDEEAAVRFARAKANGNVDQRVLRVTGQTLVVATENDL